MELSESERKCFELLVKHYTEKGVIHVGYTKLMEELGADIETCKALVGKMKEIKVVIHDYPPGWLVSEEGAYIRITSSINKVWKEYLQQEKESGSET